jgi:hypothetical protein
MQYISKDKRGKKTYTPLKSRCLFKKKDEGSGAKNLKLEDLETNCISRFRNLERSFIARTLQQQQQQQQQQQLLLLLLLLLLLFNWYKAN